MSSALVSLNGLSVESAIKIHDYAQLFFTLGITLNIYNDYRVESDNCRSFEALKGLTLTEVIENSQQITMRFDDEVSLVIDMRDEAYSGPEAVQLNIPGKPSVIWR